MDLARAPLEDWLREYYFDTEIDIGCSGVENFSLGEIRKIAGLTQSDLDSVVFNDSPTCGERRLREVIARRWGNGVAESVMVTHGSSEAIYLVMRTLLKPGDEVIVLDPCYHALSQIAEAMGCTLKKWTMRFERKFVPDIEEALALVSTRTRMIVANFPHNPTGASISVEEQNALISAAAKVGAYLVWDGAFRDLTYDAPPLPLPNLSYERAITLGTLSKTFGLAGLRVGWLFAEPEVQAQCVLLRDYTTLYISPLTELIARKAVENADRILEIRRAQACANKAILTQWIDEHSDFIEWAPPAGGVSAFIRVLGVEDTQDLCKTLAESHGVLLVPGKCFGRPQYARLGFGGRTGELEEGLARLSRLLRGEVVRKPSVRTAAH